MHLAHSQFYAIWFLSMKLICLVLKRVKNLIFLFWTILTEMMIFFLSGFEFLWEKEICMEGALHLHARIWRRFWAHGNPFFNISTKIWRETGKLFSAYQHHLQLSLISAPFTAYLFFVIYTWWSQCHTNSWLRNW